MARWSSSIPQGRHARAARRQRDTKGKWSLEGERVCFKYPDQDKDCQTISRTGDEATFNRKDKSGYSLKVLEGNPKNL